MRVRASVSIDYDFWVDVPETLLEDGNEDILDEHLYEAFIDRDWVFNELVLWDENGRVI